MSKLKTIDDLTKTTIMIPDMKAEQPCNSPCIPEVHVPINELKEMAIEYYKYCIKGTTTQKCIADCIREMFNLEIVDTSITRDHMQHR